MTDECQPGWTVTRRQVVFVFAQYSSDSKATDSNPESFKYLHRNTTIAERRIAPFHFNHQINQNLLSCFSTWGFLSLIRIKLAVFSFHKCIMEGKNRCGLKDDGNFCRRCSPINVANKPNRSRSLVTNTGDLFLARFMTTS